MPMPMPMPVSMPQPTFPAYQQGAAIGMAGGGFGPSLSPAAQQGSNVSSIAEPATAVTNTASATAPLLSGDEGTAHVQADSGSKIHFVWTDELSMEEKRALLPRYKADEERGSFSDVSSTLASTVNSGLAPDATREKALQ
jgi:hypothetical protein